MAAGYTAAVDPRLRLFDTVLDYTPVTVRFESTYEGIGRFVWGLQGLPTTVEIREVELTRGLPLMKARLVLFVFQRSSFAGPAEWPPDAGFDGP